MAVKRIYPSTSSGFEWYFFEEANIPFNPTGSIDIGGASFSTLWDDQRPSSPLISQFRGSVTDNGGKYTYGFVLKFPKPYFIDKIRLTSAEFYPLRDNSLLTFGFNYLPGQVPFIDAYTGSLSAGGSIIEGVENPGYWVDPYYTGNTNIVPSFPESASALTNTSIDFDNKGTWWARAVRFLFNKNPDHPSFTQYTLNEVALWIEDRFAYDYEFNDTVLTTKAWNSSRYTGKQLSGASINQYTAGDVTYNNEPVINTYSKTFYVLNNLISVNSGSTDDITLLNIPGFSYLTADTAITITPNREIKQEFLNNYPNTVEGLEKKKGFIRDFKLNFPVGSQVSIKTFDQGPGVSNVLNNSYNIYFNEGRLQKLLNVYPQHHEPQSSSFHLVKEADGDQRLFVISCSMGDYSSGHEFYLNTSASLEYYNTDIIYQFYDSPVGGDILAPTGQEAAAITDMFDKALDYHAADPQNRRFFVTFCASGSNRFPIITENTANGLYITNDISFISTGEITEPSSSLFEGSLTLNPLTSQVNINKKYSYSQEYSNVLSPSSSISGSYTLSYLSQDKPSLLLRLNKSDAFPNGIGDKPIVIYPENLDPDIKRNITAYMSRAGYDIGNIIETPPLR